GRPAAEDAHPPQRARGADTRLPARLGPRLGGLRPVRLARRPPALARRRRDLGRLVADSPPPAVRRPGPVAAGRADGRLAGGPPDQLSDALNGHRRAWQAASARP